MKLLILLLFSLSAGAQGGVVCRLPIGTLSAKDSSIQYYSDLLVLGGGYTNAFRKKPDSLSALRIFEISNDPPDWGSMQMMFLCYGYEVWKDGDEGWKIYDFLSPDKKHLPFIVWGDYKDTADFNESRRRILQNGYKNFNLVDTGRNKSWPQIIQQ